MRRCKVCGEQKRPSGLDVYAVGAVFQRSSCWLYDKPTKSTQQMAVADTWSAICPIRIVDGNSLGLVNNSKRASSGKSPAKIN